MAKNLEAVILASDRGQLDPRFRDSSVRNGLQTGSESFKVFSHDPPGLAKQIKLCFKGGLGILEPIAFVAGAVDTERAANCVPIVARLKFILTRKYLDAIRSVPFNLDAEAARDIQDIETAQSRRQRFRQECPEVATAARLLH